jgi:hypothetical protein
VKLVLRYLYVHLPLLLVFEISCPLRQFVPLPVTWHRHADVNSPGRGLVDVAYNPIKLSKINVELFSIKRYLFNEDEYTSTDTTNIFIPKR